MLSFEFNTKSLTDAFKQYVEVNRRDAAELLDKQANAMVYGVGSNGPKGLFGEAMEEAGLVRAEIEAAARRGPLKRPKGRSWQAEFAKRLRYAAAIQASGWLNRRYGKASKIVGIRELRAIENPPGRIRAMLVGAEPVIELTNSQPGAAEFAQKTGYVERAVKNRERDMLAYVQRKTTERAKAF